MSTGKKRRREKLSQRRAKISTAPGTPIFVGERKMDDVRIDVISYDQDQVVELKDVQIQELPEISDEGKVTWINVSGVHDLGIVEGLGRKFNLHPLTVEDIVNTSQRPKAEVFPEYLFVVLKMISYDDEAECIDVEHVSLILGSGYVISFLEDEGDVFDMVRERIRLSKGIMVKLKSDYLAYALIDSVVDHYFLAVEKVGDLTEDMDDRLLSDPQPGDLQEIHRLKRDILTLRKSVWPLREGIGIMEKNGTAFFHPETKVFLRDLYDHTIQVIDMVEALRDLLGGMHDTYLSSVSNRMNEVMKVLTIIATVFIPVTFIAGVYGMNFRYMPELEWRWGYPLVWAVMIGIGGAMVVFFKRKKWL
ncbi:MAG: magnesium/cobalt transporter CorA [Dethiosulfovibrio sp.]|nr:magnesium/cobalt transporter CorA [Dethiosulfovibrio sp.]